MARGRYQQPDPRDVHQLVTLASRADTARLFQLLGIDRPDGDKNNVYLTEIIEFVMEGEDPAQAATAWAAAGMVMGSDRTRELFRKYLGFLLTIYLAAYGDSAEGRTLQGLVHRCIPDADSLVQQTMELIKEAVRTDPRITFAGRRMIIRNT